jgi:hypothetical protein
VDLPQPPRGDLLLSLVAHSFTAPQRPSFTETLRINGRNLDTWRIEAFRVEKTVVIPFALAEHSLRIELINHDPRSPADVGYSADDRKLGLAVETLKIESLPARK